MYWKAGQTAFSPALWYTLLLKRWARLNSHPSGSKYYINSRTTKRGTWIPRRCMVC